MPTYADVCGSQNSRNAVPAELNADVCRRMLAYADVCGSQSSWNAVPAELNTAYTVPHDVGSLPEDHKSAAEGEEPERVTVTSRRMLTYADVC